MGSEPRDRVLLVGVFGKAGIWKEVARRPLPDAAEHLIASAVASGDFPFKFGRQAAAGPAAVSVGFEPRDVGDRPVRLQRNPFGEVAAQPIPIFVALPIDRRRSTGRFDEVQELGLRHERTGDTKRGDIDRVSPLLVIEDEPFVSCGSNGVFTCSNTHITHRRNRYRRGICSF